MNKFLLSWSPRSCTFIYFQPVLEVFSPDSHTFSGYPGFFPSWHVVCHLPHERNCSPCIFCSCMSESRKYYKQWYLWWPHRFNTHLFVILISSTGNDQFWPYDYFLHNFLFFLNILIFLHWMKMWHWTGTYIKGKFGHFAVFDALWLIQLTDRDKLIFKWNGAKLSITQKSFCQQIF